jgi:uncharacterized iron-regulated protein
VSHQTWWWRCCSLGLVIWAVVAVSGEGAGRADSLTMVLSVQPVELSGVVFDDPLVWKNRQRSDGEAANADVLQALSGAQVVYLAETHDEPDDHAAQLAIIQALYRPRKTAIPLEGFAIALEMFQRPFQPVLDAYVAGLLSEEDLRAQSEYDTRWGYDWSLYAPIFRYAQANQIPLVALNTPAEVTRKVAQSGLSALAGEDLDYIPPLDELDLENEVYRQQIFEAFSAHGDMGNALSFDNFFAAQVLWDETMAEVIAQQLQLFPDRQVVVLAGEGHIFGGYGIPSRVQRRVPDVKSGSVQLLTGGESPEPNATDYLYRVSANE